MPNLAAASNMRSMNWPCVRCWEGGVLRCVCGEGVKMVVMMEGQLVLKGKGARTPRPERLD
jgi:hypothetical protein